MKQDGTFVFGRITMSKESSVSILIGNEHIELKWNQVNP